MRGDALRLAVGTLTALPVPAPRVVDAAVGRGAMLWAPAVGALLGAAAAAAAWAVESTWHSGWLAAVAAVAVLAAATRGLHLDGLADTADGLGSARPAEEALAVMRRSDVGPFGVATLVLVLLAQVGLAAQADPWVWVGAGAVGRLAATWGCVRGVPAARASGLGAAVAGTVPAAAALAATAAVAAAALAYGPRGPAAVLAGLAAAGLLLAHSVRRLGGVTGDVLGAAVETATLAALAVLALP